MNLPPSPQAETGSGALAPGPRIYNLFPSLVGTISSWKSELPRIAAMGFDWVYLNPFHEIGYSGSLYAVKDPGRVDPRFVDPGQDGWSQLQRQAKPTRRPQRPTFPRLRYTAIGKR